MNEFMVVDLPALLILILASLLCAVLGSLLVLKRQAIMVDAISHSVLPGIVCGVALTGSFSMLYVMPGALAAALISITLVHILTIYAKIEQGAAIGAVFTTMFATGVVLLETQVASKVHLDTQHVLYGALELTYWPNAPQIESIPSQIVALFIILSTTLILLMLFFKELKSTIFDSTHANLLGTNETIFHIGIMVLTVLAAVACFEATGSILVIALFVCPAATARLHTQTLKDQLKYSAIIGVFCALSGYFCATKLPLWLGFTQTINAAATIAFFAGALHIISVTMTLKEKGA